MMIWKVDGVNGPHLDLPSFQESVSPPGPFGPQDLKSCASACNKQKKVGLVETGDDHNLPRQVYEALKSLHVRCETTDNRGWDGLENGDLVSAASEAGFTCILTRDVLFSLSAGKALRNYPQVAVILVRLPQAKGLG